MWKLALAGAAMIAVAGTSIVHGQQRSPETNPVRPSDTDQSQQLRLTPEDASALRDARVAAIRAALKLTPDQEKQWPAFEQVIRDLAQQRFERMTSLNDKLPSMDPVERLRTHAESMAERAAGLKRLADAAAPLYASLDAGQKRRFTIIMRASGGIPGMGAGMMGAGMMGPGMMGSGMMGSGMMGPGMMGPGMMGPGMMGPGMMGPGPGMGPGGRGGPGAAPGPGRQ